MRPLFFVLTSGGSVWLSSFSLRISARGGFCSGLTKFFVFVVGALLASVASAQTPAKYWETFVNGASYKSIYPLTSCQNAATANNRYNATFTASTSGTSGQCRSSSTPTGTVGSWTTTTQKTCATSTPYFDESVKNCVSYVPPPPPDQCSDKNPILRRWVYSGSGPFPPPDHFENCVVTPIELYVCRKDATGNTVCYWSVKRTGDVYTGDNPPSTGGDGVADDTTKPPVKSPPVTAPPATNGGTTRSCPGGTVQAGTAADGVPICMGTGTGGGTSSTPPPKAETTKTETLPDGSTKTTTTTTTTNSDGSTTTNTTIVTTAPDGTKTTTGGTTTGNNSAGQPGVRDRDPSDDKYDLCKTNPNLSICRESSVSGTCGQITCVGDAIQCATLRAAAAMECKQRADEDALNKSPLTVKGQAAIDGTDLASLPSPGKASVVDLGGIANAEQGWLGNGSAFSDVSFVLLGKTIVVPLSKASALLVGLRYALMIAALLVSFRILSGAILRD